LTTRARRRCVNDGDILRPQKREHLAGELAKVPEVRHTPSGKAVASFTVLTKYQQSAEYHRVTAWEQLAEKVADLPKGEFIRLVGRLHTRSWEDKQTNYKKYVTEIVAWQIVIPSKDKAVENLHGVKTTDDDVPF